MSLIDRFLGRASNQSAALVANTTIQHPLSLQLLFSEPRRMHSASLTRALRSFHRSMKRAQCEIDDELSREGTLVGLAGWGEHVIRFFGLNAPMPAEAIEPCIAPAHYRQDLKQRAREHLAHVLLYYAGHGTSPLEQYVALGVTAAVLGRQGALVVLNEGARASLPMSVLADMADEANALRLMQELPLPYLWCGFVKYEVEDVRGVWMRTHGARLLGLPDLAAHATGHHEAQRYFDIFDSVLRYLGTSGARLGRGHTMQVGENEHLRARAPNLSETFLVPDGELFVLEHVDPSEMNR